MDLNTCFATTSEVRHLALYSHLVPALATLILGGFALRFAQNRLKAESFFLFTVTFALWLIVDLITWITNDYALLAATWAPLDYINIAFFLLLFYFVFTDLQKKPMHPGLAWLLLISAAIPFTITFLGSSVHEFNQPVCEMLDNGFLTTYKLGFELTILAATLLLGMLHIYRNWRDSSERVRVSLTVGSIFLFMGVFALAEYASVQTEVYEIMLYALFTLPIFILILTLAITRYSTFKLGDATARMLFYVFLVLSVTQFFYVEDMTEFALAAMSFGVILSLGFMLFRSNQREMHFRQELEVVNKQQESLLHFISHEVKGYLTKGEAAFASIIEHDYGPVEPKLEKMAASALWEMRKGVNTVMNILDASNLRKGTMAYDKASYDFKKSVDEVLAQLNNDASQKGLKIEQRIDDGDYILTGDEAKLRRHVVRNLIDNAIRYTPAGTIQVTLSQSAGRIRFSVKDTGVGITPEDMKNLFTEGGHGKESLRVNVDSTGYGLFVAKQVVLAHKGKIWAESEGAGKGSEFIVELPI